MKEIDKNLLLKDRKEENKFAKAAVQAVLEKPGTLYNPLYLYGEEAERKYFVLAIYKEAIKKALKVDYAEAEELEDGYLDTDILLIDELYKLEDNAEKQNKLVEMINERLDEKKQMIFFASKHPEQLRVMDKLKSRLTWGLLADIC